MTNVIGATLNWLDAVKRYYIVVNELNALSDTELKHLGIDRIQIHSEALKSFTSAI